MDVLNDRVLKTVEKSGLDYFHFTEDEQEGLGFGQRFSNSIQKVFEKGYDKVICIGNDTPQLTSSHLLSAVNSLNSGKAVNGPSLDGGFYLMGINSADFDAVRFESLPWQTNKLASSYFKLLEEQLLRVDLLEYLVDLDSEEDIKRLFDGTDLRSSLAQSILKTLINKRASHVYTSKQTESVSFELPLNKGSPASIAA
ncbi:TIGR04282 family arsenosugar biosynthesis glycosyltransferase [Nonlabens marinus]|uniref:Glycosyltransferase n=1 Tax=Nonlabens marinus S1-08 TaxID=1454201 RepID=W8VPD1_9FLAO|nr:DUF2064 domain-containing protein [Nonlabens marinus]BAO54415.1 glycosyltransferase [Nonlabens marinus S1-08]